MQPSQNNGSGSANHIDALKQLWEEYRYRHDLCWQVITRITVASITLAILPYINDRVSGVLRSWILLVPALAVVVAAFGALVIENELDVLDRIKSKYRELQQLDHREGRFRLYVRLYIAALLVLGLLNIVVLACLWIPNIPIHLIQK